MGTRAGGVEETRNEVDERRRSDRIQRAKRLRDRTPQETLEAAFDLTEFTRSLSQVGS